MPLVDSVLRFTKDLESPRKYYYWSALAAISAVVKGNVYLNRFEGGELFPNIFVLLLGRSGLRKGPPVNLAKNLVNSVDNTRVYAGRMSIQGIVSDLSKARTKSNGGPPITEATGAVFASEFASFIIQDFSALTILTDLYDRHYNEDWAYMLRNSPTEKLKKPYVTLLGASNEVHAKDIFPENAIGGGFLARIFVIYANRKNGVNPLTRKSDNPQSLDAIKAELKIISKCKGEFKWTDEGREVYEEWYNDFQKNEEKEEDVTGTMERLHDHVSKVAMLISLSRAPDMRLTAEDVKESILACQDFIPGAKRIALGQVGGSISSLGTSVLLMELLNNETHEISRTEALKKHWKHFDSFELDRIAESLYAQHAITITLRRLEGKHEQVFILNPKVLERYKQREMKNDK